MNDGGPGFDPGGEGKQIALPEFFLCLIADAILSGAFAGEVGQHGGNVLALQAGDVGGHHHRGLFAVSGETVAAVAAELCTGGEIYIKMIIGQRLAQVLTQLFCLPATAGVADGRKGIQRFARQIACHRGGLAAVVEYAQERGNLPVVRQISCCFFQQFFGLVLTL